MSMISCRRGVGVMGLAFAVWLAMPASVMAQQGGITMLVDVDVTDAPRKMLKAKLHIPVKAGPLTLYSHKWIPGEHGPSGPITDLVVVRITAAGKVVPWHRDEVDMFAIHCEVPAGTNAVEVLVHFLAPPSQSGFSAGAFTTAKLAALNWNQIVLYPKGIAARDIQCKATIRHPAIWKIGTALTVAKHQDNIVEFAPVSLETLVDSPVLCGSYLREVPLTAADGLQHSVVIVCDSPEGLELSAKVKDNLDKLVVQAGKLFGARHYKQYKFLVTLSDHVAQFGLEHHECSDDRMAERILIDDHIKKGMDATLLPHEYVHSWNGKHRRPADMITDNFQEPQRTKLLWVYEGLTQYLGVVLTARSGLWTPEQFRDNLAQIGSWAQNQRGREWRPLEDTTIAAQLLYYARRDSARGAGLSISTTRACCCGWRRTPSFARKTKGKSSLDDFCRPLPRRARGSGPATLRPFTFDDLVADLSAVVEHDWRGHWTSRLAATGEPCAAQGDRKRRMEGGLRGQAYRFAYDTRRGRKGS